VFLTVGGSMAVQDVYINFDIGESTIEAGGQ
jgi:hypothetical protein